MSWDQLWQTVLNEMELMVSRTNFITWFKETSILNREGSKIIISVPNSFTKEWLENKYAKQILKIIRNHEDGIKELKFIITTNQQKENKKNDIKLKDVEIQEQLNFKEFEVDKETNLNPRYTFESFVRGSSNELAYAASLAIVKSPGTTYNPLFIYGGVGLGKTHLLQAIGNELLKKSSIKIKYLTSEKFTNELISAIMNREGDKFKKLYRKVDVLIIDDVQFWAGKEKTQEEFFHTFNVLYENNKQIVLSSDRPPKAIPALEDRLRSRFEGGMIADIGYPDYETRLAILKHKVKNKQINIPEEILSHIATNIQRNIRELEGALNRVINYIKVHNTIPTTKNVNEILNDIINIPKKSISINKILQVVSEFYEIDKKDIIGKNRHRDIVKPRQITMYLLREELNNSYPYIGQKLGNRDHTTIIHACEKIKKDLEKNEKLLEEINLIKQKLYCQ